MIKGISSPLAKALIFPFLLFHCTLVSPPVALSEPRSGPKKDQIEKIESQLSRQRRKLRVVDSQEKDLLIELSNLEREVSEKRGSIEDLKKKIHLAMVELKGLQKKLTDARRESRDAEVRLADRLVALYKYARRGYVKLLTDVRDMDQFWRRMKYLKAIITEDRKELVRLAELGGKHQREFSRARKAVLAKEDIIKEERGRLSSLKEELEEKAIRLMKVHKEKEFYETAVKELQDAANDLREALSGFEKGEPYKIVHGSSFQDSKGSLPLPLNGKIIRGDKFWGPSKLDLHKGIFIEGVSEGKVRAIFPGRVDFSGRLKGYGEIIVINHGSRFFTIYALLLNRNKKEGDMVSGGEVIGQVGSNGPLKGKRLYFEMRQGGENLDILEWVRVQ